MNMSLVNILPNEGGEKNTYIDIKTCTQTFLYTDLFAGIDTRHSWPNEKLIK